MQIKSHPMQTEKKDIKDLTLTGLSDWLTAKGFKPYRAGQVFKWLYQRQADTFDEMTDLGKPLRQELAQAFEIKRLEITGTELSKDGSKKFLMRLADNEHIECVLIPEKNHDTLCISSQVGCAQACRFCMTARGGLARNLTCGEIIAQVRDVMRSAPDRNLTNIR